MNEQNQNSPYEYDAPVRGKKLKATSIAVLGVLAAGAIVGGTAWASSNTSPDPTSSTSQVVSTATDTATTPVADGAQEPTNPNVAVPVKTLSIYDDGDDQGDDADDQGGSSSDNETESDN